VVQPTARLVPYLLLAALVITQATQVAHHTCGGLAHPATQHGEPSLERPVASGTDLDSPACFGCALLSHCGSPQAVCAIDALPPGPEGTVDCNTTPAARLCFASALLPRPPPPVS
jgi:hypothetical protein